MMKALADINRMSKVEFVNTLGGVFERSPWVAEAAYAKGPFYSREGLHEAMFEIVERSPEPRILELIRAHPDLVTRLQVDEFSAKEQQNAGLSQLTPREYELFSGWNEAYKLKFGFPFILAVAGRTKADIAKAMQIRLENGYEEERREALEQIGRITEIRIKQLIGADE